MVLVTRIISGSGAVTLMTLLALRPPRPRRSSPFNLSFALTFLVNEQPFLGLYVLAAGAVPVLVGGDVGAPGWWVAVGVAAGTAAGLAVLAARARTARPCLTAALRDALGPGAVPEREARGRRGRLPLLRLLFLPLVSYRFGVRRVADVRYGDAGRGHLLDVYVPRSGVTNAPVLVYLHGGGFRVGGKMLGARPLLYRLAGQGWVCVSANYRLGRGLRYADRLADVRRVVRWVREHGADYGADPGTLFLAGGSAGAHLAATAALTANGTGTRPGPAADDTPVSGVIGLYGYYGRAEEHPGSSPLAHLRADAPPFLLVHGSMDTLVLPEDARHFATELARVSTRPVVYAELPGTQHAFDFFPSIRFHAVIAAVEHFTTWVRSTENSPPQGELSEGTGTVAGHD
ncbi:alpha/beta hydrolase [Actinacidiphila yeochonensis]|uniref:alpha/beta hydrolase n=1 Tax=Actinacidiphila yeochonensis TaxID=89050 RepID=UPI001E34FACD|nr:alpha/beta hydrolase [Actinacidiphila yeochonensis]